MQSKMPKIKYLDGIRGLAAVNVLLTHFVVVFYPAMFNGVAAQSHTGAAEALLASSPWTIIYAGNLAVPLLFVLSAYVLSFRFFLYKDAGIATASAYRRYLRLEIPVLVTVLIAWLLLKFNLFYNAEAAVYTHSEWFLGSYYQFPADFWSALKMGLWECFAVGGNVNYNPVLWTMNFEMLGSFTVFGFLALFGESPKRYIIYGVMLLVFCKSYYLAFILGMILSDLQYSSSMRQYRDWLQRYNWFSWGCLAAGLMLSAFFDDNRNWWCRLLNIAFLRDAGVNLFAFYHIIGAALLLLGCFYNKLWQQFLELRIIQFFGRISFSLYLTHFIVICSFTSWLLIRLAAAGWSYHMSVAMSILLTIPVCFVAAYIMTRFVDEPAMNFVRRLQKKYFY